MLRCLAIVCASSVFVWGCSRAPKDVGPYDWNHQDQWSLPDNLREISGLAFTSDGRLFAHDDERAIVYQLDYADGAVKKRFALGDPPVEDDFEAIATTATHVYLVASTGKIFEAREGGDGESVPYQTYEAGTEEACEIEGAAYVPARDALALTCKRLFDGRGKHTQIYYWSVAEHRVVEMKDVTLRPATEQLGTDKFRISDITWDQSRARFVAVAAEERAVIELDLDGRILYASSLPRASHRQAEGIALDRDGKLLIADEGGKGQARLTIYPARPT